MSLELGLPPPFRLVAVDSIDSTNDEARRAAAAGAGHGTVIWAQTQTAGRGRRGRAWVSPPGNLHCSFLLHPGPRPGDAAQLAFVASLALRQALAELAPAASFQVKWPNDVLCGGRKIAGMLLEQAAPLIILGVGVDVAEAPPAELVMFPATCLRQTGSAAGPFDVLAGFAAHLADWHARWIDEGFAAVRTTWLAHAAGLGGPIAARLADERVQTGVFAGLDEAGGLILAEEGGRHSTVLAGDVFFPT